MLGRGPAGETGATGAQGIQGIQGIQGDPGADGAAGAAGTNGATWRTGSGAPSNGLGVDGDLYFRTDTDQVYLKASGTYSAIADLTGATGATGSQGPQGDPGAAGAAGADGAGLIAVCNGRLTTESGVPVSTADRTAQGTLYFTPYEGNQIGLYTGSAWETLTFTEKSLALTVTSGKNYDVFAYNNAGTLALELSAEWTNDSTRADALTTQDGVIVKSGALTRRWLGTIRASGSNVTEDSLVKQFVWNAYNQVHKAVIKTGGTAHSYNSGTIRGFNNDSSTLVEFILGAAQTIKCSTGARLTGTGNLFLGIWFDAASPTSMHTVQQIASSSCTYETTLRVAAGYHTAEASESTFANTPLDRGCCNIQFLG
jgi:hypothetical protein